MQKITPMLWFDSEAEEAANFYVSVFDGGKILNITHYGNEGTEITAKAPGSVMTVDFEVFGQRFTALNGGPVFKFTEAISFVVGCKDQDEVDRLWGKLSADPKAEQCGWLKDKYGVSWQITPNELNDLFATSDSATADKIMKAMLRMKKLDINALKQAAGKS